METKKSKNADVSGESIFYFQIGLILVLFFVWQALEWKAYNQEPLVGGVYNPDILTEVDVPVTILPEPELIDIPKEIVKEPEVIDNDESVEETFIASTESEDEVVPVKDILYVEPEEPVDDYSIMAVEEVPVFPGCEKMSSNKERMECMSGKIRKIVGREFDLSLGSELGLSGVHKIYVNFKILPNGNVEVLGARGPHPLLEEEAIRVVKTLPEMQPGKQQGKPVGVLYMLPITFKIQN